MMHGGTVQAHHGPHGFKTTDTVDDHGLLFADTVGQTLEEHGLKFGNFGFQKAEPVMGQQPADMTDHGPEAMEMPRLIQIVPDTGDRTGKVLQGHEAVEDTSGTQTGIVHPVRPHQELAQAFVFPAEKRRPHPLAMPGELRFQIIGNGNRQPEPVPSRGGGHSRTSSTKESTAAIA